MEDYWLQLRGLVGQYHLIRISETALILVFYAGLRISIARSVQSVVKQADRRFHLQKYSNIILNVFLALALIQVWIDRSWSLASFVGLLSAGLAFIFREPLLNLAGWTFILIRRPFSVGDRVQVDDGVAGDVVDIGLNDFTVMEIGNWVDSDQSTGRIVHIPNGVVFTKTVVNYHQGFPFIWNEIKVLLTFESDWQKASEILQTIGDEQSEIDKEIQNKTLEDLEKVESYFIQIKNFTPIVYVKKEECGILLTLRILSEPRKRRTCETNLWKAIFHEFAKFDSIEFAYPTTRFVGDKSGVNIRHLEKLTSH